VEKTACGTLLNIEAIVESKNGSTVSLRDAEGEASMYIRRASGIKLASFDVGDEISVQGVLVDGPNGKRLMPRETSDLQVLRKENYEESGEVLGVAIAEDEWQLESREDERDLFWYIFFIIVFGVALFVYFFVIKKHQT